MNQNQEPQGSEINSDLSGFLARFDIRMSPELADLALTHRSHAYENGSSTHNERLEFLGDSILGQVVTLKLFHDYPDLPEGDLAKRRASLVSSAALAEAAREFGLGEHLKLGVGEERSGGRDKSSILADALEAVIGAVYLDQGQEEATRFVLALIEPLLKDPTRFTTSLDPKTSLQEIASKAQEDLPSYEVSGEGPDHDRVFTARVTVAGVTGVGVGSSKKAAEIAAAKHACEQFAAKQADQ